MNFLSSIYNTVSKSVVANENIQAMKNEVLRKCGVKVCELMTSNICNFLPDSWRIKAILATDTGKQISTVVISQLIGNTMYSFREGLSPQNQKYLDMMRSAAWMASATALMDMTNLDRLFDFLVPKDMKKFLEESYSKIDALDKKLTTTEENS